MTFCNVTGIKHDGTGFEQELHQLLIFPAAGFSLFARSEVPAHSKEDRFAEFERILERGGVLGAMDTMYQRSKIQDESMYYEHKKHDGSLPLIGVNTFLGGKESHVEGRELELMRSTDEEKDQQVGNVEAFRDAHQVEATPELIRLQQVARERKNTFESLMDAAKDCSLGSMSHALYEVGGEYRRNM
jgi:methylmalonyl-CoA mutase